MWDRSLKYDIRWETIKDQEMLILYPNVKVLFSRHHKLTRKSINWEKNVSIEGRQQINTLYKIMIISIHHKKKHFIENWANGINRQFSSSLLQISEEKYILINTVSSLTSINNQEKQVKADALLFKLSIN